MVALKGPALVERLAHLRGAEAAARKVLVTTKADVSRLQAELEVLDHVGTLFRSLIDQEVNTGVKTVERLLTEGLQAVFSDQDLSVTADVTVTRGKVSVELVTCQKHPDGTLTKGIATDAFGGAVATVESALLRIMVMFRRGIRPLMLLDETFPAFDANYVVNMGRFLRSLCSSMGIDALVVSHNPALVEAANKAYTVVKSKGAARFLPLDVGIPA